MSLDENFLIHYGVPGMKWGVRRKLGEKARSGYRISKYVDRTNKQIGKLDKKIADYKSSNADTSALMKKRNSLAKLSKNYTKAMNRAYSGLSQKDIDQGRRAVKARRIGTMVLATLGSAVGVPIGGAIGGAIIGGGFGVADVRSLKKYGGM